MKLFDKKNAQLLERKVIGSSNTSGFTLMAKAALKILSIAKQHGTKNLWVLAGPGNNGGDAIMTASFGVLDNFEVSCTLLGQSKGDAKKAVCFAEMIGLNITDQLPKINKLRAHSDIVVDGLLGLGAARAPEGTILKAIKFINQASKKGIFVLSIDLPSGINPDSGELLGKIAVKANKTIMLLSPKQACYTGSSSNYVGELVFSDLGVENYAKFGTKTSELITPTLLNIKKISKTSHKGSNGSVLILGGWNNMQGAGFLAGLAAARTGVGKVFICTPNLTTRPMELIGIEPKIDDFKSCLKQVSAVVAGPGLTVEANEFLELVWVSKIPLVLDAYGLRWLAQRNNQKKRKNNWIGTPHVGETIQLLGEHRWEKDRFVQLTLLNKIYGGTWILKGPGTLVGPCPTYVNNFADGILATAGTGDVLAGITGGMLSQGYSKPGALATYIHSESARKIIAKKSSRLIASDLLNYIGMSLHEIES